MSTNTALDQIKNRVEKATPGPWVTRRFDLELFVVAENGALNPINLGYVGNRPERNAEFIAHARTDVPKLLAALEAVQALPEYDTWEHHAIGMGEVFGAGYAHALEVVRDVIEEALR